MLNSLWSTLANVVLTVLIDLLTAYAVVFYDFKGKKAFVKFLLLWMAVPGVIGSTASFSIYTMMKSTLSVSGDVAGYVYLYFWLVIPSVTGIFNMLLMRSFLQSIPKDIINSARCDGASGARIFFKIVCPLARSTIMLIALFAFTASWNSLTWPQLLLSGEKSYWSTVTVGLTGYTGGSGWNAAGMAMATSVFAMIPIIIIFIIAQNKMIDGLASTGVKY